MNQYEHLANSVVYSIRGSKAALVHKDSSLRLVGEGRSAFAFRINGTNLVLKVFFPQFEKVAAEEAGIYKELAGIPFFPSLHESGRNYLVMDYVRGMTLYQCLANGMPIAAGHIEEVDHALKLAREKGLNPSDIHLRNIIITPDDEVKLIDVARFRQMKQCSQWDDLKSAFYKYYRNERFPKKMPEPAINLIAFFYKKGLLPTIS
ncbi:MULTISPECIES: protein kinase family protein [Mesobacillus]|uniref:Protein kinase family protein n=1 Tax=Mesobacillus selenatarsenatis TaxID=388741 RepID=A0A846TIW1_9BACI|nr:MULTISPECIES: protein kinase family protein [Mesobacillus]NKE06890.1 protein kinase family protein [Mesobacillus selenatarsenatis]